MNFKTNNRGANKIDLLGIKFGRLLVISQGKTSKNGMAKWNCVCDCGNNRAIFSIHLRSGRTKSCGCLQKEIASTKGPITPTDGYTKMPEYNIWVGMIRRCSDKNRPGFSNYGGRGIFVADEWKKSFVSFFEDMGPRPGANYSIERIDNNGPYSADNCKWATRVEQNSNTRRNVYFEGKTLKQWSSDLGLAYATVWERFYRHGTPLKRTNHGNTI